MPPRLPKRFPQPDETRQLLTRLTAILNPASSLTVLRDTLPPRGRASSTPTADTDSGQAAHADDPLMTEPGAADTERASTAGAPPRRQRLVFVFALVRLLLTVLVVVVPVLLWLSPRVRLSARDLLVKAGIRLFEGAGHWYTKRRRPRRPA